MPTVSCKWLVRERCMKFKIVGAVAHTRPGNYIEIKRIVRAKDPVSAIEVWRRKLRGVKHKKVYLVEPIKGRD